MRATWVSPLLFKALCKVRYSLHWDDEVAERLHNWPDTGFSLPERIILAEVVWMDTPVPQGGNGKVHARLDHWLALADERYSLHEPGALWLIEEIGTIKVNLDRDGSFEPYTLRLPEEQRQRNPSTRILS